MVCAYCGKETNRTKEHIISHSVLELFPECDLTFDYARKKQYKSEPVVNDVCAECNNIRISYIDSYAKSFIEKYFLKEFVPDCEVSIEYNYILIIKMLLKYSFNDIRAHRQDDSYFDDEIKEFLMDENNVNVPKPISVFGGINVNTSAWPAFIFGNEKIYWSGNPIFLENSIIMYYDEFTGKVYPRETMDRWEPEGLLYSYLFKFNSGQFIITYWDSYDNKKKMESIIPLAYPYKLIKKDKNAVILERCTHAYNCHHPSLIDVSWGIPIADMTNSFVRTDINPIDMQKRLNQEWLEHEKQVREEFRNKKRMRNEN